MNKSYTLSDQFIPRKTNQIYLHIKFKVPICTIKKKNKFWKTETQKSKYRKKGRNIEHRGECDN